MNPDINSKIEPYDIRGKGIAELISALEHKSIVLSVLRFVSFILILAGAALGYFQDSIIFYIASGLFLAAFIVLCVIHSKVTEYLRYSSVLYSVNSQYICRITGDFEGLFQSGIEDVKKPDEKALYASAFCGDEFVVHDHDYCDDLDIFGKKSIYSLINVCETVMGRKRLAHKLLYDHVEDNPAASIGMTQEAVKELSSDSDFLQEFQTIARRGSLKISDEDIRTLFAGYKDNKKNYKPVYILLPLLWLIPVIMMFIDVSYVRTAVMGVMVVNLICWGIGLARNKALLPSGYSIRKCNSLCELYETLESAEFKSEYLSGLVSCGSKVAVSSLLKELKTILTISDLRSQPLFALLLNLIFPLDHLIIDLMSGWNRKHGELIPKVLDNTGEIEALMSLAQIAYTADECVYPDLTGSGAPADNAYFCGENICHPLLYPETRVSNSVVLDSNIALITGSNMSGKTTLIRTVGICCLLAYMGGPVPASKLTLGRMRIMSSMRIVDSIEENMSTFKAELVRISGIIEAGKSDEALLFLIDEIFRGTNSDDRTAGAYTVLSNLSRPHICGMMTTHDYSLVDKTENKLKNIVYYYFSEKYDDTGITFDYMLRPGISRSSNAKYLMKLVGIDKGDDNG
ncbi:MAG: hypothetical protein IKE53_04510 [Clostridiales bacterium]|nr:hypothetical protein [Clostridiales bacterium]